MDLSHIAAMTFQNVTPFNVTLLVLLVLNTIIAENPRIKSSSIYGIFKTLLFTVKDQAWPQGVPPAPAPLPSPSVAAEPAVSTTPNQ